MMKWPGIGVLLIVLAACTSSGDKRSAPQHRADINIRLAMQYYQQNRLDLAQANAKKAWESKSDYAPSAVMMALVSTALNRHDEAEQYYNKALEYISVDDAMFGMVHNNYGVFLCDQDKPEAALEMFNAAAEHPLYKTRASAYENAGICLYDANQFSEAETYFRKALEQNKQMADSLLKLSQISFAQEQYFKARAYIERYFSLRQADAAALWLALRIEQAQGAKNMARKYAGRLKSEFPNSDETRMMLQTSGL